MEISHFLDAMVSMSRISLWIIQHSYSHGIVLIQWRQIEMWDEVSLSNWSPCLVAWSECLSKTWFLKTGLSVKSPLKMHSTPHPAGRFTDQDRFCAYKYSHKQTHWRLYCSSWLRPMWQPQPCTSRYYNTSKKYKLSTMSNCLD